MKTLIVYATKYGCTTDCVNKLKDLIPGGADAVNVTKSKPDLDAYDNVIIGGSVYIGQLDKKLRAFMDSNMYTLLSKKLGLFLVCGLMENADETLANAYPKALIEHAQTTQCFGGELRVEKMGFWHKKMVGVMSKQSDTSTVKFIPENIAKMAAAFS